MAADDDEMLDGTTSRTRTRSKRPTRLTSSRTPRSSRTTTFVEEDEDDDADEVVDEEEEEDEEEDADEAATTRTKRRAGDEEEDDDDELLSPDDVEADLDRILKDRLVTAEDDEDEDDEDEPDDRSEGGDRLQPKRADEQLCPNCFLLVRATAPGCPVGDDACPIFG